MSRRRSTGDLVPKDITEILAREAKAQRGQRKHGSSLGQAFSWLRGSRRKKSFGNGLNCTFTGITDPKLGLQNPDTAKAGPKENEGQKRLAVHYTASQHYQENVFIEGSRSQYLEDLHTEAQEGLKILQQEEHKNGVNFPDDESIASTDTLRPEQYLSSNDGGCSPESSSSTGNTDGTLTSAVMTEPALSHQGSTFKPQNPVKRLDRSKKRSRRTTIMGIPNQVQKELALHRSSTFQPLVSTQLPDHNKHDLRDGQSGVIIIPTVDGGTPVLNKEGARVHLSELEAFRDEELRKHLQAVYKDEHNHQDFSSHLCPTSTIRPKSLAVPGMTTSVSISPSMFNFLHEPQGPVMSISPQATYLSTIIPNAVLPASVEVIEIDRSTSWTRGSSVNHGSSDRAVSKSSLTSGDSSVTPLLSRSSDGDGSQNNNSHNNSMPMAPSPSGSNWSEAQSSKMIISNSSPSSKRGDLNVQDGEAERSEDQDLVSLRSVVSVMSELSNTGDNATEHGATESAAAGEHAKDKRNSARSLSVMKTKQPPAPPRRTNSLHSKKIRNESRVVVEIKDPSDCAHEKVQTSIENNSVEDSKMLIQTNTSGICTPGSDSTRSSCEESPSTSVSPSQPSSNQAGGATESLLESSTSSPQKTPPEGERFERTMSPSSGYSSQSGTPTLSPKEISSTSPDQQKKKPVKPERSVSRASSSAASPSSSLTSLSSGTSELANPDVSMCSSTLPSQEFSPTVATKDPLCNDNPSNFGVEIRDLLNIPPPPKVKAPRPPPPETWAHNRHTVELLCGPFPNASKEAQKPTQIQDTPDKQAETGKNRQINNENLTNSEEPIFEMSENKTKPEESSAVNHQGADMEDEIKECPVTEQIQHKEKKNAGQSSTSVVKEPETQENTPKKDPPPVMKKPLTVLQRKATTKQPLETRQMEMSGSATVEVDAASQSPITVIVEKSEKEMDQSEAPPMHTLTIELPKINKISPPPTPPPTYHPTPPPLRKPHPPSGSIPANELQRVQEELQVMESCWPPPPPPLDGESAFEGEDDADFPPPPPPLVTDSVMDVTDDCIRVLDLPEEQIVQKQDLRQTISQPAVTDSKPLAHAQASKAANSDEEASCPLVTPTDGVTPPSGDSPLVPPVTRADSPLSVMALPPCNVLKQNSLKADDQSPSAPPVSPQPSAPTIVPVAPSPPTENLTHGVNFRRQPSGACRDTRSKELLSRHKSALIPKEDANIPLVTPSLLQMVRLRSVSVTEDQPKAPSEDKSIIETDPAQGNCPVSIQGLQNIPQKPIRKSLSLKSPPQTVKTSSVTLSSPSMRMQEAIRMKTAAMSSRDSLPSRLCVKSPSHSCTSESGSQALKSPESSDMHKSPASTASFIFSRSTKKVIIETAAASFPEAQASLKQSLAAELMQVSEQSKAAAFLNGAVKCDKVPPPVAKKPTHSSMSPSHNSQSCSSKMELSADGNVALEGAQHTTGLASPETTTRVTADTIETLF
ncbi:NHS-like protein 3 [Xenentodon cancila]